MEEILTKRRNKKIIIFSNYIKTFDIITELLIKINYKYKVLKGRQKEIVNILDDFKSGKINVLMLNLKHFGNGFNLQETDDIIIYHRFKKEYEEQLISKAQRIGRTKKLNVYYLLHDNESNYFDSTHNIIDINYNDWLNKNI